MSCSMRCFEADHGPCSRRRVRKNARGDAIEARHEASFYWLVDVVRDRGRNRVGGESVPELPRGVDARLRIDCQFQQTAGMLTDVVMSQLKAMCPMPVFFVLLILILSTMTNRLIAMYRRSAGLQPTHPPLFIVAVHHVRTHRWDFFKCCGEEQ